MFMTSVLASGSSTSTSVTIMYGSSSGGGKSGVKVSGIPRMRTCMRVMCIWTDPSMTMVGRPRLIRVPASSNHSSALTKSARLMVSRMYLRGPSRVGHSTTPS